MRFIQRDKDGKVCGHYANPQDYATELVADDHHELVEWDKKRKGDGIRMSDVLARIATLEQQVAELLKEKADRAAKEKP